MARMQQATKSTNNQRNTEAQKKSFAGDIATGLHF